jgi:hypothetical protein
MRVQAGLTTDCFPMDDHDGSYGGRPFVRLRWSVDGGVAVTMQTVLLRPPVTPPP